MCVPELSVGSLGTSSSRLWRSFSGKALSGSGSGFTVLYVSCRVEMVERQRSVLVGTGR